MDWRSTIHWNVVLAIFQHNHICQDCWKNTRSTFICMVIPKFRGKGPKRWRTKRQICPILSTRIWTLSPGLENNQTIESWSGIFPTILTFMIMLENYQNNISVYGCFPIQGTTFYSCWNLMKPGSQSGTYARCNSLTHVNLVPNDSWYFGVALSFGIRSRASPVQSFSKKMSAEKMVPRKTSLFSAME